MSSSKAYKKNLAGPAWRLRSPPGKLARPAQRVPKDSFEGLGRRCKACEGFQGAQGQFRKGKLPRPSLLQGFWQV